MAIKITANDRSPYDKFGHAVSISGDFAVVGAWEIQEKPGDENSEPFTGGAYVFTRSGAGSWSQLQKLVPNDIKARDRYGYSVSISDHFILVGAPHEDEDNTGQNTVADAGSIYVYEKKSGSWEGQLPALGAQPFQKNFLKPTQWSFLQKLNNNDRITFQWLGGAVAVGDHFAIGSSISDYRGSSGSPDLTNSGSAYIFVQVPRPKP
jgi:hypothetical protein